MGFLSGIVHAIGNGIGDVEDFFGGNNKKKANAPQQQSSNNQNNNNQNNNNQGGGPSLQVQPVQQQQLQQSQQNQNQPVQTPNGINLTLLNNNANNQPPTANQLVKANPQPTPPPSNNQGSTNAQDTPAPAQHASILHDITHNPITNAVGGLAKNVAGSAINVGEDVSNTIGNAEVQAGKALGINAKTGVQTNQQQFGNSTLGIPTQADSAKNVALNTVQLAANVLAPGTVGLAERGITALAPDVASQLVKIGANSLAGGVVGGVGNTASAIQQGQSFGNVVKAGATGVGGGALIGGILPEVAGGLRKVTTSAADTAPAANEVATGVKSVNPTQVEDAGSHVQAAQPPEPAQITAQPVTGPNGEPVPQISHEAPNAQAPQIQGPPVPPEQPPVEPVQPNAMHSTETEMLNNLDTKAKTAELTPAEKSVRQLLQNKQDLIDSANAPPEAPTKSPQTESSQNGTKGQTTAQTTPQIPATPVEDLGQKGHIPKSQVDQSLTPTEESQPKVATPVENSSSPTSVAQENSKVNSNGRTAPNAPNVRAQANKALDEASQAAGDPTTHNVLSRADLKQAAEKVVNSTPPEELLTKYSGVPDMQTTSDLAHGKASMPQLAKIIKEATASGDTATADAAKKAIDNIIEGSEKGISRGADVTSYAKEMYDSLPKEAKVSYTIRTLNKAREQGGMAKIGENADGSANVADRAAVEANLDKFIGQDEAHQTGISAAKDTAENANASKQDLKDALNSKTALDTERSKNAGDFTDYYKSLLPDNTSRVQKLADFQRTAMLSSPSGRINALGGTGLTTLDAAVKQGVSGLIGKVHNAVVGAPEKAVTDTGMNLPSLVKGVVRGAQKIKGIAKGQSYADNPDAIMNNGAASRNALSELPNNSKGDVATRLVKAALSGHQNLTMGVKDSELLRLGRADGAKQGLSGDELDKYALRQAINPEKAIAQKAQDLHDTMNNLNDNVLTRTLSGIANNTLAKIPGVGPLIKNQILPFSHFLGGNIYNSVTDRNVVAASLKTLNALRKGDTQGVIDNFSKFAVESGKTYGLGYLLTQHGMVTNKDAQGNNYQGTYVHVGNRSVPATSFGAFGPAIILGNAVYNAFNSHNASKGDILSHIADTATQSVTNAYRAYSGQDLLGGGSSLPAINQAFNSHGSGPGALSKVVGNVAGQFVPAATGDVNAVLNNGLGPIPAFHNPNHEAANTKVINPNSKSGTAKDPVKSAEAAFLNKIPGASQFLPRNPGVAAADIQDKLTKGNRATGSEIKAAAIQQSQANQIADYAQNPSKALNPLNSSPAVVKAVDAANKKAFAASNKQQETLNGMVYQKNAKGGVSSSTQADYNTATADGNVNSVQRGIDTEAFKQSGKQQETINGVVYQRADDGTVKATEQKDYNYQQADTGMTEAKKAQDFTGYQQHSGDLLKNISDQLQNPNLSSNQIDTLTNKALAVQHESAMYDTYQGFTRPKGTPKFVGVGQLNNAKPGWSEQIQKGAAKYNLDGNALLAVASMEGLGGGVGDGGHAFGPFQMNDAVGVLKGRFPNSQAAQAYAESPAGIEDAIKQISQVAGGLKGQAAINAIVNNFERPANPSKEIAGASGIYNGGSVNLSSTGSGGDVTLPALSGSSSKAADAAAKLVKDNTIKSLPKLAAASLGKLAPAKVATSVPVLQKIIPSDLVKMRSYHASRTSLFH